MVSSVRSAAVFCRLMMFDLYDTKPPKINGTLLFYCLVEAALNVFTSQVVGEVQHCGGLKRVWLQSCCSLGSSC